MVSFYKSGKPKKKNVNEFTEFEERYSWPHLVSDGVMAFEVL